MDAQKGRTQQFTESGWVPKCEQNDSKQKASRKASLKKPANPGNTQAKIKEKPPRATPLGAEPN